MKDQTLVEDRPATDTPIDETVEHPTVTDAPVEQPAAGTPTSDTKVTLLRGKRAMAAAAAGLVLVGGAAGFAVGHATAGESGTSQTGFGPGGQGGPGGQTGQGGPGGLGGPMGQPPGTTQQNGTGQPGTTDGTTSQDGTTSGTSTGV